jgi:uncharacterized repeat protein (TIGR01451 family)
MIPRSNLFHRAWVGFLGAALLFLGLSRSAAQTLLPLGVAVTPVPAIRNEVVVFRLNLTNLNSVYQSGVVLTNVLDPSVTLVGVATNTAVVAWTNNAGSLEFRLRDLDVGQFHTLSITGRPSRIGTLTNLARAASVDLVAPAQTNLFAVVNRQSDIAVGIQLDELEPLTGQSIAYRVTVTNRGPDRIESLSLSHVLPAGTEFQSASGPAGTSLAPTNGVLLLDVGALASGTGTRFIVTVGTTAARASVLTVSVPALENDDPVVTNNTASARFLIQQVTAGQLAVSAVDAGVLDRQSGLIQQRFRLENLGTNTVPGARIFVAGITNSPSNLGGTNLGRAFVQVPSAVAAGDSLQFVLEYFSPTRLPLPAGSLAFEPVPVAVVEEAPSGGTGVPVSVPRWTASGPRLEFPAVAGRRYRIVYGGTAALDTSRAVRPVLTATGNRVQWTDLGPPYTSEAATSAPTRFYRIQEVTP